ncbi:sugar ABC transporter ATP-binding protein [Paraburkholderia sp. SG-MS1]|uniref:sugar ABC transporter ATP-binding protein n=1 Tax=Paraburkholderia sp. SG-MS1 TaxID=2023741 RepID=UPI0014485380|nr:sugar ABC transporter ATP-binding protein [Paraburkholderia sp. SG-MS1]
MPLVSVRHLGKRYGGVVALRDMSLEVMPGTVHAVVGENGAGKSTLMKVLAGAVRQDSGEIAFEGQPATIGSPNEARALGIGIVNQELSLFPERSVLANLFANREPRRFGLVSPRTMEALSRELLEQLGLQVDVHGPVADLSIGEQQLVELSRVLLEKPRLLILDEPNSALNERETARLFTILKRLREQGMTMLYVSHRLEEVFDISDTITITRNGADVATKPRADLTIPEVIEGMIGTQQQALFPPPSPPQPGLVPRRLDVRGLRGFELKDISFSAQSGEIVGFAGLEGAGVATLFGMLFGTRRAQSGDVLFPDQRALPRSPTQAARRGICLVPADRRHHGLMLDKSILFNMSHVAVGALSSGSAWFGIGAARFRAQRQVDQLRIKTGSDEALAGELSGGNQQKIVIGKWLETNPDVIILEDPTRGVDVGAKREIYELIRRMSAAGKIVLFNSTELTELIGLCDRIFVLYRGRLAGELSRAEIDDKALLHLINTGTLAEDASAHSTRTERPSH